MPDRKKVAAKTYLNKYADWSFSFRVVDETNPDGFSIDTLRFVKGEFTTDFADEQAHLEALPQFIAGVITVKPSPRAALASRAIALRAVAVKANADAKASEDALAAFDKPVVAAPAEPEPETSAQ